jgi:hypothetical protein
MIEDLLMPGGDPAHVDGYIGVDYIHHNAEVLDGIEPFSAGAQDRKPAAPVSRHRLAGRSE